jgi:hypothetical protein
VAVPLQALVLVLVTAMVSTQKPTKSNKAREYDGA